MLDSVANFVIVQLSHGHDQNATAVVLVDGQGAKLPAAPFNVTQMRVVCRRSKLWLGITPSLTLALRFRFS